MQALRHPDGHEDAHTNNGLAVAKAAFGRPADFNRSQFDDLLRGTCRTQAKAPAALRDDVTPVDASGLVRRADHDLVVRLCRMPPDLAAPLLRSTLPALNAAALLTVLAATGEEHHRLVAARPHLDWRVVKAVIRRAKSSALVALAENISIDLDDDDQRALASAAEHIGDLRDAILRRPGLATAHGLIQPAPDSLSFHNLRLLKLVRAGLGDAATQDIARRLKADPAVIAAALAVSSAVPLALAACALGLDRAVFTDLLHHWQSAHGGGPTLSPGHRPIILSVFAMEPAEARRRLLALAS